MSSNSFIELSIINADNVPKVDLISLSDPYIKFYWNRKKYKTSVLDNTLNPTWNQKFQLPFDIEKGPFIAIFELWDYNSILPQTLIGETSVDFRYYEPFKNHSAFRVFDLKNNYSNKTLSLKPSGLNISFTINGEYSLKNCYWNRNSHSTNKDTFGKSKPIKFTNEIYASAPFPSELQNISNSGETNNLPPYNNYGYIPQQSHQQNYNLGYNQPFDHPSKPYNYSPNIINYPGYNNASTPNTYDDKLSPYPKNHFADSGNPNAPPPNIYSHDYKTYTQNYPGYQHPNLPTHNQQQYPYQPHGLLYNSPLNTPPNPYPYVNPRQALIIKYSSLFPTLPPNKIIKVIEKCNGVENEISRKLSKKAAKKHKH